MKYILLFLFSFSITSYSQDDFEELIEDDLEALEEELNLKDIESNIDNLTEDLEGDLASELDSIEEDFTNDLGEEKPKKKKVTKKTKKTKKKKVAKKKIKKTKKQKFQELEEFEEDKIKDIKISDNSTEGFDVGAEERELLSLADKIAFKIDDSRWENIKKNSSVTSTYQVVEGDWLFKISKNLFGTGHYYPKIWALNPYITNPHEIEPGMILIFDTGAGEAPTLSLQGHGNYSSDWLAEKKRLKAQGVHVEYASDSMAKIVEDIGRPENEEYKKYTPPRRKEHIIELSKEYGEGGFSKSSVAVRDYKQGFSINTFLTPNKIEDFGYITDGIKNSLMITNNDKAYIKVSSDQEDEIGVGDVFSVYSKSKEKSTHKNSDRSGYKYSILGHVRVLREIGDEKWEVEAFGMTSPMQRGDRLTVYTPKIEKIYRKYNSQLIEAIIVDSHAEMRSVLMSGDIAYLDRGREDGVRIGDVFGVFSNADKKTKSYIDKDPVYLLGKLVVISLTEDFATVLVLNGGHVIPVGAYAQTLTEVQANTESGEMIESKGTTEVEIEEDLGEQVLEDAEKLKLSEDELEELDRIENQKSFIDETEKDLKDIETLEKETEEAESILDEEDKKLIEKDLEDLEQDIGAEEDELEAIEKEVGKKYLDEELNEKENPYGLSENDLEEVDELLEVEE